MARPRASRRRAAGSRAPSRGRARLLAVLRALADGTRLAVFLRVARSPRPVCVRDLVERVPVSQPTISHHLRVLREAGLLVSRRRGTWTWWEPGGPGLPLLRVDLGIRGRGGRASKRPR
jgi:ArsR family transcriptional regulator